MNILALDLGTKTGWALLRDGRTTSGTWVLATATQLRKQGADKLDKADCRPAALHGFIQGLFPFDWVYFEDVQFASSQMQAQLWGGFRAIVQLFANVCGIRAVPVGTLKKWATGKGNATKDEMVAAIKKTQPDFDGDDNEADALHLLAYAKQNL